MTIAPAAIEARARQLCAADGHDPDRMCTVRVRIGDPRDFTMLSVRSWTRFRKMAEEQLRAEERNDGS